jgi:hypothetical protein
MRLQWVWTDGTERIYRKRVKESGFKRIADFDHREERLTKGGYGGQRKLKG